MKNKKSLMAISALLILIYHLWINITDLEIEIYFRQICVIGVDIFFFISAYNIGKSTISYKDFITNRFKKIYLEFVIFSIIGAIYFNWSLKKILRVIFGFEFIKSGGGSFLWFIPGIMIIYLILPLIKKLDVRFPKIIPFILPTIYMLAVVLISIFSDYNAMFILINRIPVILIGYYFARYDMLDKLNKNKIIYWTLAIISTMIGIMISYFIFKNHFKVMWFKEIFYILYIPLIIGVILIIDKVNKNKLIDCIGSVTLELYGIQMLFGFKIANNIYNLIDKRLISNVLTIITLIILAVALNYLINLKEKLWKKNLNVISKT